MKAILCFILISLSLVTMGQATPGSVSFTFKTLDNNKHFSPAHVIAIWVEDGSGNFVKTLQVQAARRIQYLYSWKAKSAENKVDAVSGPTLPDHSSHTVIWDCKDTTGKVVKDGLYKIVTEFTSEHAQGPIQTVSFTKGISPVKLSPANQPYFQDMNLIYTPGKTASKTTGSPAGNPKTALLIIDIQDFYFPGEGPGLVNVIPASLKAKEILQVFREKKQLVIHVRHKTTKGFGIHESVAPIEGEKVITKEDVNSFLKTDLLDYLKRNDITRLVIIGMQTHLCLEAATRAGHDYGFECVVVQDACATKDVKFGDKIVKAEDVHNSTLATINGTYGKVIDLKTFKENQDMYLFQKIN